jgi:hypothetical protein
MAIIDDTNPQLGGNLDLNNFNILGTGSVNVIGSGNYSQGLYVNSTGVSLTDHTHQTNSITNFNSSVSGLVPVINVVGSGNINVASDNKTFTVTSTGLIKSDVTTTSGASVVNNIVVISEASYNALSVKDSNTIYFIT